MSVAQVWDEALEKVNYSDASCMAQDVALRRVHKNWYTLEVFHKHGQCMHANGSYISTDFYSQITYLNGETLQMVPYINSNNLLLHVAYLSMGMKKPHSFHRVW